MPLTDSFLVAIDDELDTEFSGIYNLIHQTDLSDNPQKKTLYLGSLLESRQLQASSLPGTDNIIISVVDTLPTWEVATAYEAGDCVQPTTPNGLRYRCTADGTSHASVEPTWPTSGIGSTVTDGTTTWELQSAKHETTEIKLALTEGGLTTAVAGDPLILASTILGGTDEAIEFWIQIDNDVETVTNTGTIPDICLSINGIIETDIP